MDQAEATYFEVDDVFGRRTLVVPAGELLWSGNPVPILLDYEARTRTRLKDGGNPVWFIRLHQHFRERSSPLDGVSFAEYIRRRHRNKVDVTTNREESTMAIKDEDSARILASCARHCCICRRFKPLHLQVHHIRERADGGSDDIDNLIAVCLTCHSDVHTRTRLSRRFSEVELKLHRDSVINLVSHGKLPGADARDGVNDAFVGALSKVQKLSHGSALMPESIEMLLKATTAPSSEDGEGPIIAIHNDTPFFIRIHTENYGAGNPRQAAKYKKAFDLLIQQGLIEHFGGVTYRLTDDGWAVGDQLLASGLQ